MKRSILGVLLALATAVSATTQSRAEAANAQPTPPQPAIQQQLTTAAWPIRTAIPDGNLDDLAPLGTAIGSARIVGFGEATHGTSEFFSLKDRMWRFLVERMGFTVFAMEMPWTSGLAIDDYVTGGKGDVRSLLANTDAVWDNQEVADLIDWMRSYNAAPGAHATLRFVGIDPQEDLAELKSIIASESTSRPLVAQHAATVAAQHSEPRDRAMAENVEWSANVLFPQARILIWAHNAHIMVAPTTSGKTMGTYLRTAFDANYYAVGFAFDGGTISPNGVLEPISLAQAPASALESELRTAGLSLFGLNLRSIPDASPLGVYLSIPRPMRMIGSIDTPAEAGNSHTLMNVDVSTAFDSLVFVEQSHAAHSFRVPQIASPTAQPSQSNAALPLTGQQILDKAVEVWENQTLPPFETFTLPCHELMRTGAEGACGSSTQMRVQLRTDDGMAHVETIPHDGAKSVVLLPEGRIYGPAGAPLGFTRKIGGIQRIGSLAADPLSGLKTIADVTATNTVYNVGVANDVCNGTPAYHLALAPRIQASIHPLRELVVDRTTFKVCSLRYAIPFNGGEASVRYNFEDRGNPPIPFIVKITAVVPYRSVLGTRYYNASETIDDITFPNNNDR